MTHHMSHGINNSVQTEPYETGGLHFTDNKERARTKLPQIHTQLEQRRNDRLLAPINVSNSQMNRYNKKFNAFSNIGVTAGSQANLSNYSNSPVSTERKNE